MINQNSITIQIYIRVFCNYRYKATIGHAGNNRRRITFRSAWRDNKSASTHHLFKLFRQNINETMKKDIIASFCNRFIIFNKFFFMRQIAANMKVKIVFVFKEIYEKV